MKKKQLCLWMVIALLFSMLPLGSINAAAEEKAKGGYGTLGSYSHPTSGAILRKIMFAMPGAWQNSVTADERCGGYASVYWWGDRAIDAPDRVAGGHGWPGWRMDKETGESGVTNLFSINAPVYGNGEAANGPMLVFTNYLDGGTDDNPHTNMFYEAACQTSEFSAQYYSKNDLRKVPHFEKLFRYTYLKQAENCGVNVSNVSMDSDTFWEDINRAAAAYLGENWYYLDEEEQTYQIDMVFDDQVDDLDFSEYGTYASNFYNEDLIADTFYSKEESNMDCLAFTFDNMVYVVDLDPDSLKKNALSQKLEFSGGIFFYYGNGEYGTWPTKELNRQFGGVLGNFMDQEIDEEAEAGQQIVKGAYLNSDYNTIKAAYDELHGTGTDPTDPSNPGGEYTRNWTTPYGGSTKIYFDANSAGWLYFTDITFYLYQHGDGGGEIITWGSKKGKMTNEGNGIWSFDLEAKGYGLDSNKSYGCIFTADWGMQTCDLIIGRECYGDLAYCTGNMVENNVDPNKRSNEVRWANADRTVYGNPICITSIGNVIGTAFWPGDTAYSIFLKFLSTDGVTSIVNALKYNGKSEQQTIDDTAAALRLSTADIERAIRESGRTFNWSSSGSSGSTIDNYVFTGLDNGTQEIKDYYGKDSDLIIPSNMSGSAVTSIGEWAFYNNKYIKTATVPDSVTQIGNGAFDGCQRLSSVTIGNKVKNIGKWAFCNCKSLETVYIPEGVKTIGEGAFYNCFGLKDVYYGGSAATWNSISFGIRNEDLKKANVHYAKSTPVSSVTLSKTSVTLTVNQKTSLKATVSPTYATNKTVKWSTSNSKVATVDSKGNVVAKAAGTATITATSTNSKKATCKVTVTQPVTKISLNKTSLTISVNQKTALKATVGPTNATNKTVKWSTSNSKVATVDSKGNVVAKAAGTATITATAASGKKATCKITVTQPVTKVALNKTSITLKVKQKTTLKATVSPSNATNKTVKWSTSSSKIATVDSKGNVVAKSKGTATITATAASGKKATCKVTVKK